MVTIVSLWLPILLSAVLVFAASSVIHMLLGYHKNDFGQLLNEDGVRGALGPMGIQPGEYAIPRAGSMKAMSSPEYQEKLKQGPVAFMTVLPNGPISMGSSLIQWFLYSLLISVFAAYIATRALAGDAEVAYLDVFRFAGATAFMCYAVGTWQASIWYKRKWSTTAKTTLDGLVYALLTAGCFAWLWPN